MEVCNNSQKNSGSLFLVILSGVGAALSYYYPFFALTMLSVPALWAAAAFKSRQGFVTLLLLTVWTYVFGLITGNGALPSLLNLGFIAPAGILLYVLQRQSMGNTRSVLYLSVVLTFGLFLVFCVPALQRYGDAYAEINSYFAQISAPFAENAALKENVELAQKMLPDIFLSFLYSLGALYALVNVRFLHHMNRRHKDMPLCPMAPFGNWSLPRLYGPVLFSAVLVLLLLEYAGITSFSAATNLLYEMLMLPMMLLGAQFIYRIFLLRRGPKSARRITILLTAALLVLGGFVLFLLGMFSSFGPGRIRKEKP